MSALATKIKDKTIASMVLIALLHPMFSAVAEEARLAEGYGLIAHWPFDENFASSVNGDLYNGAPVGEDFVGIEKESDLIRIGEGSLRIDSGRDGGNTTYVAIRNPLFGRENDQVFTLVGWYRFEDLSDDGSDTRNFIWETSPGYSLAFGLRNEGGVRDAEWWFLMDNHESVSDTSGPVVPEGTWCHVATVWNARQGYCKFYHNGALLDTREIPKGVGLEEMTGFHIGNHRSGDGARDWDGHIDDVGVFDVELTHRQIRALADGLYEGHAVSVGNVFAVVEEIDAYRLVARPENLKPPVPLWSPQSTQGPFVGHVSPTSAKFWGRIPRDGAYQLDVLDPMTGVVLASQVSEARAEEDWTLHWNVAGLDEDQVYRYRILGDDEPVWDGEEYRFRTAPAPSAPGSVSLAFASCAGFDNSAVWTRMATERVDGLVLLGDTPYIDTTNLAKVRDAYRRFASIPTLSALLRTRPFWGTWDDHDFGLNDSDGTLPLKENSRQGFVEYRPNLSAGHDSEGVYTKFRYGPIEVFLIDARWFSRTERSWADPEKPTLTGRKQWEWLQEGLLSSEATFKVLATGMIWDDKKNSESDDWGTYAYERAAIQRWIGENQISGVVLVGGDIHVSRVLKYPTEAEVGYPIYQFISSPVHGRVIPSLNVPHPALLHAAEEPHVFLKLTADTTVEPATLNARWVNKEGATVIEVKTDIVELSSTKN